MAGVEENSSAVLQGIARHVNCLKEDNRNTRKRALEDIKKDTQGRNPAFEASELQLVFSELLKPLLKGFSDPVEKCRELSIGIVQWFLENVPCPEESLSYVFPILVQRLGQQEIVESSEEIRFKLVELTLVDPYPEVKKESCKCASEIAKTVPQYFYSTSEHLIKPLLLSITHQHSKIRALVVETLGDVIRYGHNKSVDQVTSHFAQRLFDQVPMVRKAVTQVVGMWLLDLPDRYSFHHLLVPLLLTSITDDQPEICELADSLWHDVGIKYEQENEDDFKDKQDFVAPPPSHYPPHVERPNIGCRVLVNRHASKILPGLMRDICDWVVETRIKSAKLLYTLLINLEEYTTQHIEILISGMSKASLDEEKRVVEEVNKSAELVGYFVRPDMWCKVMLKTLRMNQSYGNLFIMAGILRGSLASELLPYLEDISTLLTSPEVCHTAQVEVLTQLLACVEALVKVMQSETAVISQKLFDLIITVMALTNDGTVRDKATKLIQDITVAQGLGCKDEFFRQHTHPLLQSFGDSYIAWTNHSPERHIFNTLLIEAGPVVGELLEEIVAIFKSCLKPEKDPEVRLKSFALLSQLMMNAADTLNSQQRFEEFAVVIVKDVVLPNCVWQAGRTAAAVRTAAVSCLWALLQSSVLTSDKLEPVAEELITQMITTMDDDNKSTRLISCRVLTRTFDTMGNALDQDRLHNLYPELLKRLDDSSDEIRMMVTRTFLAYFDCFQNKYDVGLYRAHLEALYKGLLVHLDDPEEKIQEGVLEVLKKAGQLHPNLLLQEVENVKHKHRDPKFCNRLIQHMQAVLAAGSN
ncbi:hypothetical protein C0Q70_00954 [Pomacea canaliculata]|uniref:TOG domain-containing protein n=1 Tax=Pomacea canaliculata TaxID=400727 RepID=A0A2T7PY40_POMCA|nr:hypothetical protein C0Q70_00954 [Pomacea canaliculata]